MSVAPWWARVRVISPRTRVRVADVDPATGEVLNQYSSTVPVSGPVPAGPVAVPLADRSGRYHLLAWDLDVSRGPVEDDRARLTAWLAAAGIAHVVCESGPSGGRHVWAAVAGEGADPALVGRLARGLAARLPTLDICPLTNPITGAVRPPGSPHRAGGCSQVLAGDLAMLEHPSTTEVDLEALYALVGPAPAPVVPSMRAAGTSVDDYGHPHLIGARRALPAGSRAAAEAPLATDASAVAWTVLLGAARARWRHADVADLARTSPGLEHLRSAATLGGRRPRSEAERAALLERQWARAVAAVAATGDRAGDGADESWVTRAAVVVEAVEAAQARADVSPGRWTRPGGPADRRVLDAVCQVMLSTMSLVVDLDIRTAAALTGVSRETARYALIRLDRDGWVHRLAPAAGPYAAAWSLLRSIGHDPAPTSADTFSTRGDLQGRSHVVPPPGGGTTASSPPATAHTDLLARISGRLQAQAHDVFTGRQPALGHVAGAVWAWLHELAPASLRGGVCAEDLAEATGYDVAVTRTIAAGLVETGLAKTWSTSLGVLWRAASPRTRTTVARRLGVHGVLAARSRAAAVDRETWAWWQAEEAWMHTKRADRRRAAAGQDRIQVFAGEDMRVRRGPYPRTPDGRADHRAARARVST